MMTASELIRRSDAMGAVQDHFNADGFKGYDDGQQMMDKLKALPSAEAVNVAYICDGRACNGDCTSEECTHTKNIEHAKNFIRIGDAYMESAEAADVVRCKDCKHHHTSEMYEYCDVIAVKGRRQRVMKHCSLGERRYL